MTKEEIKQKTREFSDKYGEITLLRANIAAINKMLDNRGKSSELYKNLFEIMEKFEKERNPT
jgi:hypothetical protein